MTVRELNGWAPATVTFNASGEVVSTTTQEPRFTPAEKAILLASRRSDAAPRGAHGLLLSESTDPANQFTYNVPPPTMDWAGSALGAAQAAYQKANPNTDMSALLWRVEKLDVV